MGCHFQFGSGWDGGMDKTIKLVDRKAQLGPMYSVLYSAAYGSTTTCFYPGNPSFYFCMLMHMQFFGAINP